MRPVGAGNFAAWARGKSGYPAAVVAYRRGVIASRRLVPILALRERAEQAAERAHAERMRSLAAAEARQAHYLDLEGAAWERFAVDGRVSGGTLAALAGLQQASHRRVISAAADVYDAQRDADKTRQALVSAMQARRTIERLHERAQAHERAQELQAEQAALDELATLGHAWRDRG